MQETKEIPCWTDFHEDISGTDCPEMFNYPFCYDPHPLALKAAEQLKAHICKHFEMDDEYNFSLFNTGIGKMLGVLVVRNQEGQLGFLSAFSGKLYDKNHHKGFVPPIFDTLDEDGFYKKGEAETNIINRQIERLENAPEYLKILKAIEQLKEEEITTIEAYKKEIKEAKAQRQIKRSAITFSPDSEEYAAATEALDKESIHYHYQMKKLKKQYKESLENLENELAQHHTEIKKLKDQRRKKSSELQHLIFENYRFFNAHLETKNLYDIFDISEESIPPSGAGECAAPKLLHYAYRHGLKPITMAEFWLGYSPNSEIRKHGHFYPACISKCKPILGHMLVGLNVEDNPLLNNPAAGRSLPIVYHDEAIIVVNKPAEFLAVPGKTITDSVYERIKLMFPEAKGPIIIHRLDMSTSGIMILAKNKEAHQFLQRQFITRQIHKRYIAQLSGIWYGPDEGEINLPMRVDLDNRPRQLVCYEYGKPSKTRYKIISKNSDKTRIHFFPITGRTHQLRIHASHPKGLDLPIIGDDLYGIKSDRLHLHAEYIEFVHPLTREKMSFMVEAEF